MKKYLALIVGMLLVLAMASGVYAETKFTMSGDARVRGTWRSDYDFNDSNADTDNRWWDYRIRLGVDAVADGGTKVSMKLTATNWNEIWTGGGNSGWDSTTSDVSLDYGYIEAPLGKNVTATLGKVVASWGKGFMAWDQRQYRFILGTKFGDTIVKAFTQKNVETTATPTTDTDEATGNLDDYDAYSILAVHKTKDLELGAILIYNVDDRPWSASVPTGGKDGIIVDGYFHGKWGNLQAFGELSYKGGDIFEVDGTDADFGGFLHVDYKMGAATLIGAVAFTTDGYIADNDFTPTFFYGTSQSTGMLNFGQLGDTTAGLIAVSYAATKELSLMGKVAFASVDRPAASGGEFDLTEIDLGLTYKINKSTTYAIDFGYLMPDGYNATDDSAIGLAHRIVVSF